VNDAHTQLETHKGLAGDTAVEAFLVCDPYSKLTATTLDWRPEQKKKKEMNEARCGIFTISTDIFLTMTARNSLAI